MRRRGWRILRVVLFVVAFVLFWAVMILPAILMGPWTGYWP